MGDSKVEQIGGRLEIRWVRADWEKRVPGVSKDEGEIVWKLPTLKLPIVRCSGKYRNYELFKVKYFIGEIIRNLW